MHGHTHSRHGTVVPKRVDGRDDWERASSAGEPGVAAQKHAIGGGRVRGISDRCSRLIGRLCNATAPGASK
eukprot:scaffold73301_cov65-Phaeocystis_antarctica.AAC.2